jgi:hypothetical protein
MAEGPQLERRLRSLRAPGEGEASLRAWQLVAEAYERERRVPPPPRRRALRPLLLFAAAVALAGLAISPAGAAVAHWVADRFGGGPGVKRARPALTSLPAPGRLLVGSRDGTWILRQDGSRRLLGPYRDATWSPHGLYVAAVRGSTLLALDPRGRVRWTLSAVPRPRRPSWSPGNGFRVAYLSGASLRVVAGDGTGDRLLARPVQPVRPAWRPGSGYRLTYVSGTGRIRTVDADSGRPLWRTPPYARPPFALGWTADGTRLLALSSRALRLLDGRSGTVRKSLGVPARAHFLDAELSPSGRTVALARFDERAHRSEVLLLSVRGVRWHVRRAFAGVGRFTSLRWSPDGRWLLVSWRDADQWLFLRSAPARRLVAVSNIGRAFEPDRAGVARFPRAGGWCCPP